MPLTPGFQTPLDVRRLADRQWRLLAPVEYISKTALTLIVVPVGFVTDFASVPRWLPHVYAALDDVGQPAAVVHDYLYQTHKIYHRRVTRPLADRVFLEALEALGVSAWRRGLMYAGVRLLGWGAYKSGPQRYHHLGNAVT